MWRKTQWYVVAEILYKYNVKSGENANEEITVKQLNIKERKFDQDKICRK